MTAICAFDFDRQGRAQVADIDAGLPGDGYRWVHWDLADPDLEDWITARLPSVAIRALTQTETRPRALSDDGALILILRGMNLNEGQAREDMVSVRLWATETLVVTVRARKIFALNDMRDQAMNGIGPALAGVFVDELAERLITRLEADSLAMEDEVDLLEDRLFENAEDPICETLSPLRRSVIRLRRHIGPMSAALREALELQSDVMSPAHVQNLRETANRALRTHEELDAAHERLSALTDHLDMEQASRVGRNGYLLSVIAAIFLPLGFLTGLFGVNVAGMPGTESPMAFVILTLAMIGIGIAGALALRWLRLF